MLYAGRSSQFTSVRAVTGVGWDPAGLCVHVVVVVVVVQIATVCNANISAEIQTYMLPYGCGIFNRDGFNALPSHNLVALAPSVLIKPVSVLPSLYRTSDMHFLPVYHNILERYILPAFQHVLPIYLSLQNESSKYL